MHRRGRHCVGDCSTSLIPPHRQPRPPRRAGLHAPSTTGVPIRITRHALPLIACAVGASLALTGCTNDSDTAESKQTPTASTAPKPTPVPSLTQAQAREALAHYSKTNNLARHRQERALLDTVEGGPRYAMSLADIKQDEALPQADREPYRPWSYDLSATDLYIPRLKDGRQRWFAAVTRAGSQQQYARVLILAESTKSKQQWEMVATIDIDDPKQLPQIVLDKDGYATAVDATSSSLAAPVGVLRSAVTDNFATGGETTSKKVFNPSVASQRQIKVHDETTRKVRPARHHPLRLRRPAVRRRVRAEDHHRRTRDLLPHPHPARRGDRPGPGDRAGEAGPRVARHQSWPRLHLHVHLLRHRRRPERARALQPPGLRLPPHRRQGHRRQHLRLGPHP